MRPRIAAALAVLLVAAVTTGAASGQPYGSRPAYVYDYAEIISPEYEDRLDLYARQLDDATTAEIVVYTIPSFVGHGISKDGQEIQERDMLANYIFNEVPLDGVKGIGKAGKNNGLLVLLSLERDSGGGSMRIEVGRGLEGNITDGTAGQILDSFLVPARSEYEETGNSTVFGKAFLDTVTSLGALTGYVSEDPGFAPPVLDDDFGDGFEDVSAFLDYAMPGIFIAFIVIAIILSVIGRRRGKRGYGSSYGGWSGGSGGGSGGGGGGGGGGGSSGGGGAGR
ncbi:MAG TPA: TPM domain-containing protein [Nitrososphaera sp.]|nr:TPM domain-containing protein [Nitrososphaera sp.]